MAYQPPLTERIRIQLEIYYENCIDCVSSLSQHHRKPIMFLATVALLFTMKSARASIKKAKRGGLTSVYSGGTSTYGSSGSMYGSSSIGGGSLYGGGTSSMSSGLSSSPYGSSTGALGASSYGGGLRGTSTMGGTSSMYGGTSSMGSSLGGSASGYGGTSSMGSSYGSSMGMGMSSMGGSVMSGGGGGATASLADANPTSTVTLDPTIKLQNYGGAVEFSGQIETVQAYEAPTMVSQVLSQPGQNKVLIIDSGGSLNGAVFDAEMANTAMRNGWKGVIVNGAVRNVAQLQKLSFGVKALGTNPNKGKATMGQKGGMATMGSTQFQSGWWVYSDADGVLLSQTSIGGGSFGGSSAFGGGMGMGTSTGSMGMAGSAGGMGMGASTGSMGMSGYGSSGMSGGYGSSAGGSSMGSSLTGGYSGGSSMGSSLTGAYGSRSGLGGTSSLSTGGYGGTSSYTSSYGGYGSKTSKYYGSARSRKKNKLFKILLASSLAAIVWVVCLR
mmetsp:Transcript_1018/g.2329  ORF Transcript_1018/g.2329 Transcript_1018/m.2329 type:complete len:499 (-) Transcript_1018:168-1664(-)